MGHVYVIRAEGTNLYKIGMTEGEPFSRLSQLQTGCPHRLIPILSYEVDHPLGAERRAHHALQAYRREGEWFELPNIAAAQRAIEDKANAIEHVATSALYNEIFRIAAQQNMNIILKIFMIVWAFRLPKAYQLTGENGDYFWEDEIDETAEQQPTIRELY